jgi:hypothetical protein
MAAMSDRLSGAMAFKALQPLDGGFADLVMTPRRPAAQLAPLHRVDHRTLARSPIRDQLHRRLQPFVTSMTAPVASGWSGCRVGLAPTGKRCRTHGAHVERTLRIAAVAAGGKRSTALNAIERLRTPCSPDLRIAKPSVRPKSSTSCSRIGKPGTASGWSFCNGTLAVSSALHWLWSSTSWAREGFSLFATVSDFLTPKCRSIRHCCRSVQRLEICDEVGALGVVLQTGVDHRRVRHHRTRIGEVFVQGGGVPGDV